MNDIKSNDELLSLIYDDNGKNHTVEVKNDVYIRPVIRELSKYHEEVIYISFILNNYDIIIDSNVNKTKSILEKICNFEDVGLIGLDSLIGGIPVFSITKIVIKGINSIFDREKLVKSKLDEIIEYIDNISNVYKEGRKKNSNPFITILIDYRVLNEIDFIKFINKCNKEFIKIVLVMTVKKEEYLEKISKIKFERNKIIDMREVMDYEPRYTEEDEFEGDYFVTQHIKNLKVNAETMRKLAIKYLKNHKIFFDELKDKGISKDKVNMWIASCEESETIPFYDIALHYDPMNLDIFKAININNEYSAAISFIENTVLLFQGKYSEIDKNTDNSILLIKNLKEDKHNDEDLLSLYYNFESYYYRKEVFKAILIGTYIFSSLRNYNYEYEYKQVKGKLNHLFRLEFGEVTNEAVNYLEIIYKIKDSSGYKIDFYENHINIFKKLFEGKENKYINADIGLAMISNYLGLNIYYGNNYEKYLKYAEELKGRKNIIWNNEYKLYNNIALLKLRNGKEVKGYYIKNVYNAHYKEDMEKLITFNNYIGIIASEKITEADIKEIRKVFKKYYKTILDNGLTWYYPFFYNINLQILKNENKFKNRLNGIPFFSRDLVKIPVMYEGTKIGIFFEEVKQRYLQRDKKIISKENCEYPFKYLFIDFQEWNIL